MTVNLYLYKLDRLVEIEEELGYEKYKITDKKGKNSRNGYSKKTVQSELGNIDLKAVYTAINEDDAIKNLDSAKDKWYSKYPRASVILLKQNPNSKSLFEYLFDTNWFLV